MRPDLRPGIVHLGDLGYRYMWDARKVAPFLAATGLVAAAEPAWRAFAPPSVLVVIVPADDAFALAATRPWLAEAEQLIIVRDRTHEAAPGASEPSLPSWSDAIATLPGCEVFDWVDGADPRPCHAAISRALEHVASRPRHRVRDNPDLTLPASAWVEVATAASGPSRDQVSAQLVIRDGHAHLIDARGVAIDLAAPTSPIVLEPMLENVWTLPSAPPSWRDNQRSRNYGVQTYGVDPIHPIAWRGHRMRVHWWYVGQTEIGPMSATDHDFPCGPAKKLWGHDNNDPVSIAVTPTADACAQTFEHDVMITVGMPIGWHRAGEVDVAAFAHDPRRAVFYAQTSDFAEYRATDDLQDEDNRELAPAVVLGPDAQVRYAIDLGHRVVRINGPAQRDATATIIGGPDEGYAIFDADHQLVRRGTGTLLGGWFRHATIEDDGVLWREDLATGQRTLLGSATRVVCVDPEVEMVVQDAIREGRHDAAAQLRSTHATREIIGARQVVPIPGTRNVLELAPGFLRVL